MKINLELNLVVTFLYEFLLLKVLLFALYLSLIEGTELQPNSSQKFNITTSLRSCSVYTSVSWPSPQLCQAEERQATN